MTTVAIIQARFDSNRLPGKVLKPLGSQTVLQWVVNAAQSIAGVDQIVVATSDQSNDDPIAQYCEEQSIECFRGSKNDVLDRVVQAAKHYHADTIMRITADCPFIDPVVAGTVLRLFKTKPCDYACNVEPPSWPDGLDIEVVDFKSLENINTTLSTDQGREHVTLHIRRNRDSFEVVNYRSPDSHLKNHRWTLDNEADYEFLNAIAKILDRKNITTPSYLEILDILESNPEVENKRSDAKRNEALETSEDMGYHSNGYERSLDRLAEAESFIPTGSQTFSKSRTQFPAGHSPLFLTHGNEGRVWDVDGNEYVDMVCGLLPVVLGYNDPDVDDAIRAQLDNGISFSLATTLEAQLAEKLVHHIPCAEKVRFSKNGTDATSAAVRLSRAFTGRDLIAVCGYHGWQDWYIGSTTRHLGIPQSIRDQTLKLPFNDLDAIETCFKKHGDQLACIMMEPASLDEPKPGFLEGVKSLCEQYGIVLVFDEIVTGFRFHIGGAQAYYGVTPDLSCFGKAMANGMPLSTVVGRADIMKKMEDVFFSGTFGGETLSLAASLCVIDKMERLPVIDKLWNTGKTIADSVNNKIKSHDLEDIFELRGVDPWKIMMINDYKDKGNDISTNAIKTRFIIDMVSNGVLSLGSHNICYAHNQSDIDRVCHAYDITFEKIAQQLQTGTLIDNLEVDPLIPVFQVRTASK